MILFFFFRAIAAYCAAPPHESDICRWERYRPQHLNELYKDLQINGTCSNTTKAIAKRTLSNTLCEMEWSKGCLARESGVAASTITAATAFKPISMKCAEEIAEAPEGDFDEFFKVDDKKIPLSDKTVLEHHRLISTILAQAEKETIVVYNAAAKATPPRPKAPKSTYYQPDEMDDILKALEDHHISADHRSCTSSHRLQGHIRRENKNRQAQSNDACSPESGVSQQMAHRTASTSYSQ